jgi:hypothetical protein
MCVRKVRHRSGETDAEKQLPRLLIPIFRVNLGTASEPGHLYLRRLNNNILLAIFSVFP